MDLAQVLISARNPGRATQLLGNTQRAWTLAWSNLPESSKRAKHESGDKDNSDDVVLAAHFARIAATHPFARVHVVSGDKDFWGGLSALVRPGHRIVQVIPTAGHGRFLRNKASDWTLDDSTQQWAIDEALRRLGGPR